MKILAHFCESLRDAARAISSSLETENFEQAWKACHKIAGTAELLGFSELGRVSRSLSVSVKDGGVTSSEDIAQLTGHASACLEYRDLIVRNFGNWKEYL